MTTTPLNTLKKPTSQTTFLRFFSVSKIPFFIISLAIFYTFVLNPLFANYKKKYTGKGYHYIAIDKNAKPKYPENFKHLDYINPDAPSYGKVVLAQLGNFDNLNPFIPKGETATGIVSIYDTLLAANDNEKNIAYGQLAEKIFYDKDRDWVGFQLRKEAKFHDGKPVTVDDVIWSFNTLIEKGNPLYRHYYGDVKKVEHWGKKKERKVRFIFKKKNNEMPFILGQLTIFPKHFWKNKDFSKTTLTPPLGSGPYRIKKVSTGKFIEFERVENYWGKDVPIMKGLNNFKIIHYDYYRSLDIMREALRSGKVDFFSENSAKNWALGYNIPAVKDKRLIKERIHTSDPAGLQGFFFNTRRPKLKDRKVRLALDYAFDYEWLNKNLFFNSYSRATSYFNNSDMASTGLPSKAELKLLAPFKKNLPPELFTEVYQPPKTDGSGNNRKNLRIAKKLLEEAGWKVSRGILKNTQGKDMRLEILITLAGFERILQPYVKNLKRLGIIATIKVLNRSQFENRKRDFDFDIISFGIGQTDSPGNEQLEYWGSKAAETKGSRNLIGIKNPAVDAMIQNIIVAQNNKDLITATRALDRVLLWNNYVITGWFHPYQRILYWDIFDRPKTNLKSGILFNRWWIDKDKYKKMGRN